MGSNYLEIPSHNQMTSLKAKNVIFSARKPSDKNFDSNLHLMQKEPINSNNNNQTYYGAIMMSKDRMMD